MKITSKDLHKDDLKTSKWLGVVEDINDPLQEGRVRIRVFGKTDGRINLEDKESSYVIPTDKLPWSRPANNSTGGSGTGGGTFSTPKIGSVVEVTFDNGNFYSATFHWAQYPSDELKEEYSNSYENAHSLLYDTAFGLDLEGNNNREGEHIKVFFTEEKGFMIDFNNTSINIKPDNSIFITNPNEDTIELTNEGLLNINIASDMNIKAGGNLSVLIEGDFARVTAKNIHLDSLNIELGEDVTDQIIKGNAFAELWKNHKHPTPSGLSAGPVQLITEKELSSITRTQ